MPTYAYQCKSCNYEFDEFQRISDPSLTERPSCKKQTLIRIIGGGAGLVFKGSGFYLTDYKKSSSSPSDTSGTSKKPDAKTETKAEAKVESKSESKSEGKPESKSSGSGTTKAGE